MAAPKGNKYALGNSGGRPKTITIELVECAEGYFEWLKKNPIVLGFKLIEDKNRNETGRINNMVDRPITLEGLSCYLRTQGFPAGTTALKDWSEGKLPKEYLNKSGKPKREGKEISRRLALLREEILDRRGAELEEKGLLGLYNSNLAKLLLMSDYGKREKADLTSNSKDFNPDKVDLTVHVRKYVSDL
jgi:hypothetical protein